MKQFLCVLVTLLASAGLLLLVSAPVNTEEEASVEAETHVEATVLTANSAVE